MSDVKTLEVTPRLRFVFRREYLFNDFGHARDVQVLQQAWFCRETGETEWIDVPTEKEDTCHD